MPPRKTGEVQMGRLFNLDSPLMVFLSKVADLMILNIITLFYVFRSSRRGMR